MNHSYTMCVLSNCRPYTTSLVVSPPIDAVIQLSSLAIAGIHSSRLISATATFKLLHRSAHCVPFRVRFSSSSQPAIMAASTNAIFGSAACEPAGNAAIVSPEHCDLLDGVQRLVDDVWAQHGPEIAGQAGFDAIRIQAARDSHPQFPIFAAALGATPSLGNGRTPASVRALYRCTSSASMSSAHQCTH